MIRMHRRVIALVASSALRCGTPSPPDAAPDADATLDVRDATRLDVADVLECAMPAVDFDAPATYCPVPLTSCDPHLNILSPIPPAPTCALAPADAIIILGAPANDDGTPSTTELGRVDLALRARDMGLGARFITTGAAVANAYVEAYVLRDALIARGVSPSDIFTDPLARHTDENVYYSSRIMLANGWQSAVVVSELGHLFYTAVCDMNCCVQLGRATLLDYGGSPALLLMRLDLFPGAAPFAAYECPTLIARNQCPNLPTRLACLGNVDLGDRGM